MLLTIYLSFLCKLVNVFYVVIFCSLDFLRAICIFFSPLSGKCFSHLLCTILFDKIKYLTVPFEILFLANFLAITSSFYLFHDIEWWNLGEIVILWNVFIIPTLYMVFVRFFTWYWDDKMRILLSTISIFYFFVCRWLYFNPMLITYQSIYFLKCFNYNIALGYDGLSLLFIFLTCFIIPLCIFFNYDNDNEYITSYFACIFCIEILLLFVFSVSNIIFFFIFFELILIPFFILIGLFGSRDRKVHASYLLIFYTLFGSVFMLLAILFMYLHVGSTSYYILSCTEFSAFRENLFWFAFFISFGIKAPMFPFHIWLPEAHVESPTEGSVILAAILLKIGGYGFFRILLPIFPNSTMYFSSFIFLICFLSVLYTSFTTLRQTDIKRIIAYSSISHMNVAILGFIGLNVFSLLGSLLLMLGHGFVSGGLFFLIGILYDRYKTKTLKYYSGLMDIMPIFSGVFFFFVLGNISLPMTSNFIGEFLVLLGILSSSNFLGLFILCISIYFCSSYTLLLYNRITFGLPNRLFISNDLVSREAFILAPLVFMVLFIGVFPMPFISILHSFLLSTFCNFLFYI